MIEYKTKLEKLNNNGTFYKKVRLSIVDIQAISDLIENYLKNK